MATVLKSTDEVIRREVCCNGVYLGSITATAAAAIAYFQNGIWLGMPPDDPNEPPVWTAEPLLM